LEQTIKIITGKDIAMLFGKTGVGKSTTTLFLSGA
jgi:flagellar biosynthesis GTPase FlhF